MRETAMEGLKQVMLLLFLSFVCITLAIAGAWLVDTLEVWIKSP